MIIFFENFSLETNRTSILKRYMYESKHNMENGLMINSYIYVLVHIALGLKRHLSM